MIELAIVGGLFLVVFGAFFIQARRGHRALDKPLVGPEAQAARRGLKQGDFGPLEALLSSLRQESFSEHDHVLLELGREMPFQATMEMVEGRAGDPVAHLIAGSALIAQAWKVRGSDWAENVPESAWVDFHAHLEAAAEHLATAAHLAPAFPSGPALHLMVARGLGYPPEDQRALLSEALKADPGHFGARWTFIGNSSRKWNGDNTAMLAFARAAVRQAPAGSPLKGLLVTALAEAGLDAAKNGNFSRVARLESELDVALENAPDPDQKPNSRCWSQVRKDLALFYFWTGNSERAGEVSLSALEMAQRF